MPIASGISGRYKPMFLVSEPFNGGWNHAFSAKALFWMGANDDHAAFAAGADYDGRRVNHRTGRAAVLCFFSAIRGEGFEFGKQSGVGFDDWAVFVFHQKHFVGLAEELLGFMREFDLHSALAALPFWRNRLRIQHTNRPIESVAGEICAGANAHVSPALFDEAFHVCAALILKCSGLTTGCAAGEDDHVELIENTVANLFGGNFYHFDVVALTEFSADAGHPFAGRAPASL